MAYRRRATRSRTRRTYRSSPRRTYRSRARTRRRATPRGQRLTIVLQQAPQGMLPAGLTLGKKNYTPVRATL